MSVAFPCMWAYASDATFSLLTFTKNQKDVSINQKDEEGYIHINNVNVEYCKYLFEKIWKHAKIHPKQT